MIEMLSRLWLTPVECWKYSAVRIGFAVVALINALMLWKYRLLAFTEQGISDPVVVASVKNLPSFSIFEIWHSPLSVSLLFVLAIVIHVALLIGFLQRWAIVLSFIWHASIYSTGILITSGWDEILCNFSFLLMISPLGGTRLGIGKAIDELVPRYGIILMRIQVLVIYWQTVFHRFDDEYWMKGEFMYYYFQSFFSRFSGPWALDYVGPLKLCSWTALAVELAIPILLFFRKSAIFGVILGLALHLGIVMISRHLELFSCVMLMTYLSFLRTKPCLPSRLLNR